MDQYNFYINKQYLMKNQAAIFLNEQNNRYKNILQDERILAQSMSLYIDMTGRSRFQARNNKQAILLSDNGTERSIANVLRASPSLSSHKNTEKRTKLNTTPRISSLMSNCS